MSIEIVGPEAEALLSWHGLCEAFEAGHRLPRAEINDLFLYRGADTLLDRAAWIDGLGSLVKVATVVPGNAARGLPSIHGAVNLFNDQTGVLEALVDFHLVTKWKTAGDSLLSASKLARKDSRNILLVGAGTVARSMVQAYAALFPDAKFSIWNRSPAGAAAMAAADPRVTAVTDLEAAVRGADVICTATMSREPLLKGAWLQPGQHIDLIGAYTPAMREADDEVMRRASLFVDSRATTVHHIGELKDPIARGVITEADIKADFYDMAQGAYRRTSDEEITVAKNGGGAHLDLMTSAYILAMWRAR
ncbi:ornithine cyclodeaminase family protein [Cypionkella sp.]|jgi:ornithine cyclodeaminase|uniref:ornithine cyclodeaminase family protein n=1 Tax=Cypionkella sp. TaxID=2811411 RepID=UPI002727C905|nr:ornithine cyclodeaminase [Cypionkella sp.]MDO8984518.1 ornithine cyclodeaminase [Cypionkella sp.]MDP2047471.1 ornithine cyclodeaminase [Cypionkella sp.]